MIIYWLKIRPCWMESSPMTDSEFGTECGGGCADVSQFTFVMAFQPVVNLERKTVYAYEALVRGANGESAASVLSEVTEANRYAFDQACRVKAIQTAAQLGLDRRLNINFMPNAVYHPEACLRLTLSAARQFGFRLDLITFEFTEDEQITDRQHLQNIITAYRRHGFKTALDDFGAGYAGLSLLADFQPDIIKIDRVLVTNIHMDKPRQAIVAGLMQTAKMLDIAVVAEGVESRDELQALRGLGVNLYQGFLFAKPAVGRLIAESEIPWP